MRRSNDEGITYRPDGYHVVCRGCGTHNHYKARHAALKAVARGTCHSCRSSVRRTGKIGERAAVSNEELGVYRDSDGAWCAPCPQCGAKKAYSQQKHARNSARGGKLCKGCAGKARTRKHATCNGLRWVDINAFKRGAKQRGLSWRISLEFVDALWEAQGGRCALTGLDMKKNPRSWSIDRIDNDEGYTSDNVHLVDKRVNMMKGTLSIVEFVDLCKMVAEKFPDGYPRDTEDEQCPQAEQQRST